MTPAFTPLTVTSIPAHAADADVLLRRDERARLDRLKKADDLFNANLKPKAAARATAASTSKAPAKRKR